jgi:HlyD family secretion protein
VLLEIADVSDIYAVVNVDEADIGDVRELAPPSAVPGYTTAHPAQHEGAASQPATQEVPLATLPEGTFDKSQKVDVTIETFPQEKFSGVIERIAPQSQIVQAIATFKVWIRITSENRSKLVGLLNTQCEAHFKVRSVLDAILVDYDAIRKDPNSDRYGVYMVTQKPATGKPDYQFRTCKFGIDNGDKVEVIEGLKVGEKVWTQLPQQTEKEKQAEEQAAGTKKKR